MTDKATPKKETEATISAPTLKVEATGPVEKPRTPEQDAQDAKAGRQATEGKKAAENQELIDAGKVVPPAPITSYEAERAKLGVVPEGETPTEPQVK